MVDVDVVVVMLLQLQTVHCSQLVQSVQCPLQVCQAPVTDLSSLSVINTSHLYRAVHETPEDTNLLAPGQEAGRREETARGSSTV